MVKLADIHDMVVVLLLLLFPFLVLLLLLLPFMPSLARGQCGVGCNYSKHIVEAVVFGFSIMHGVDIDGDKESHSYLYIFPKKGTFCAEFKCFNKSKLL